MNTIPTQTSPSTLLSQNEISKATQLLTSSRDNLLDGVRSLDDSQWSFTPGPGRWSIAEILEHVVVVETRVHGLVGQMPNAPAAESGRENSQTDEFILAQVPDRSTKFQAPPAVSPTGQWSRAETVDRFVEGRRRSLQLLADAPSLRGHVLPHPIFGPWDGYQWILAAAAHGARHTDQIGEVKSSPGFPESRDAASAPAY